MKKTKKLFAMLMILCMLVPLFGISALAADKMTNDPGSAKQWGMKAVGMDEAWGMGPTGKDVKVGIIDCGLSTATGDIARSRVEAGPNYTGSVGNSATDIEGHGTFVAGIIGAAKDNGVGIAGVAPECDFYIVKALGDMAQAVKDCADAGCQVINMSMGTSVREDKELAKAIAYAGDKGVIVIASVGNEGTASGPDQYNLPAAYDSVIGVGCVDKNLNVCEYSNKNDSVFVVAPGDKVASLSLLPGVVTTMDGTSFSTPFVTGLAALLLEMHPGMTTAEFKEILMDTSDDLGAEGYDIAAGYGMINVPEALRYAADKWGYELNDTSAPVEPDEPSGNWNIFDFSWLREFFQNIIRNLFKGLIPGMSF